jgi:intracellular sulfur oxidation DsrE/DsrF family protein
MANLADMPRRSFLTQVGTAGAAAAAAGLTVVNPAAAQTGGGRFQAARHPQDDWLDAVPGKHRLYLDALTGPGAGDALLFAGNFLNNSKDAYQLADSDSAVVICLRHFATPFAWNDSIWTKYGEPFTQMLTKINDPKTGKAPTINLYRVSGYGMQLNNLGTTIDDLLKRGVNFAVCDTATRFVAGQLAQATKGDAAAIISDLKANTIANSHYVSAGIVATNRAQEKGYTLAHCG